VRTVCQPGLHVRQAFSERHDPAAHAGLAGGVLDQLVQAPYLGAAEVVAFAVGGRVVECLDEAVSHVVDPDRGKAGFGAGQWEHRAECEQAGETAEQPVTWPEDHRGPEAGDREVWTMGLMHQHFAASLGAQVVARAIGIGVECAHMQQASDPGLAAGGDDPLWQGDMSGFETAAIALAFVEDSDQVDHHRAAGEGSCQSLAAVAVYLVDGHPWQYQQFTVALATPGQDTNGVPFVM